MARRISTRLSCKSITGLAPAVVGIIAIVYNIGAVLGCFLFGTLSQRFGRRLMMMAAALLALSTIWLWAYSPTLGLLTLGAFLMNFFVQGCWSIIPAHLNELSPAEARAPSRAPFISSAISSLRAT